MTYEGIPAVWRYVQGLCLFYLKHEDKWIRGAAAIGLRHLARIHKTLDDLNKHLPKPH